jgi:hypothetical protein
MKQWQVKTDCCGVRNVIKGLVCPYIRIAVNYVKTFHKLPPFCDNSRHNLWLFLPNKTHHRPDNFTNQNKLSGLSAASPFKWLDQIIK